MADRDLHLGLIRGVDRRRGLHVYAVGARTAGDHVGELGALTARPREGSVPVWLTPDGRLVADGMPAPRKPSLRSIRWWVLEPLGWDAGWGKRVRGVATRIQTSLRRRWRDDAPSARPSGDPVGYLVGSPGPTRLPLYGALHPITGDQLLTTTAPEAEGLGYGDAALLGHLAAAAPVTGALHRIPGELQGGIDRLYKAVSRESFRISGWALWPPEPVARVEIAIDGVPAGRARLGLHRTEVPNAQGWSHYADAWICGFELWASAPDLPPGTNEVNVAAVVVRTDGERAPLSSATVTLRRPPPQFPDLYPRAAGLRARVDRMIARSPRVPSAELRILVTTHSLLYGGAQRYLFDGLRRLAADPRISCSVVSPSAGPYAATIEALGIPVHVTGGYPDANASEYEGHMLELATWAAPQSFDLVWANTLDCYHGVDLATRLGVPVMWSIHESFDLPHWWAVTTGSAEAQPYARQRVAHSLGAADALVFAADATRRQYEPYCPPERAVTFPYGLELDEIARYRASFDPMATRRRLGIAEDATVVLSLGTIDPRKCQALVAQAFDRVATTDPKAQLVLVGDLPGHYSTGIHEYVARSSVSDRVRIARVAAAPYEWHGVADVLVLASDIESSPFVILEAMAFETPVVATGVFGVPELIDDGVNGYLCEPSDLASLSAALERALGASKEARREIGRAGGRRVRERHDPALHEQRIESLITDLMSPAPGRARSVPERVSVLIPTLNAGEGFERSLEAIRAQEGLNGVEILVADSGSSDDTVEVARRAGARVESIDPSDFNHGGTRNLLAGMAEGDVLLTTVQDATLTAPTALRDLAQALRDEPRLAAISATYTPGPGADLHSHLQSWLRREHAAVREGPTVDNVCAAIRRSAWEQLRFRELAFMEDLDFGLRAHAAGWTTAESPTPLAVHHHDRTADHILARTAAHRLYLGVVLGDLERHLAAASELEPLLAAVPAVLGELQAVLAGAVLEGSETRLARYLHRVIDGLGDAPATAEPAAELALVCRLCATNGAARGAVAALRTELLASFESAWLMQFALAHPDPVDRRTAEAFVARVAGSALGEVLGDAMRDARDSETARRLLAPAVGGSSPTTQAPRRGPASTYVPEVPE